ncbi:M28 family peptidase [Phnomibacter ginsenosidimutans]|uniref:M20/M25/M40 family metallo-hydrolase n=1 Tax=Phnomibacter ginsenosidimutans TaxID=2676868 RepID=A0A6I6G9V3_9BACT|nr:M28 family peptidase [Phnomibacter ginsenosidimutans]QGW29174.1 M20/M25/M40 family metallo-hydrolase [Phnomibacter ginsenosidimutans]
MKFILSTAIVFSAAFACTAQKADDVITPAEVSRVLGTLSSDAMEGRRTFTPGIEKAAAFIAEEFKKAGLQPGGTNGSFLQSFSMYQASVAGGTANVDGQTVAITDIICQTTSPKVTVSNTGNYEVVSINAKDNFFAQYRTLRNKTNNLIIFVDTAHRNSFQRLKSFAGGPQFASNNSQVYVLSSQVKPAAFQLDLTMRIEEKKLANVVAVLPGKSKPNEYVIFSGHYDHLGYGKPNEKGDSLYNGANDDASGTTAAILLAKYFKALGNNERTLVFAAFTAEEVGGYGATYFSKQYKPEQVMAMFNIEMIGTDSKWGTNSAYITGYEKSSMGTILEKNLQGTAFKFYPDPYPDQQLFYRSDNATLARLGVPAHTISTSKMDSEPHYHKASDEIGTLDTKNMAEIIRAIALSSRSIVSGTDTPTRVDTQSLR